MHSHILHTCILSPYYIPASLRTRQTYGASRTCLYVHFLILQVCTFAHPTHLYSHSLHTCVSADTRDRRLHSDFRMCIFSHSMHTYILTLSHLCLYRHARQTAQPGLSHMHILTSYIHIHSHTLRICVSTDTPDRRRYSDFLFGASVMKGYEMGTKVPKDNEGVGGWLSHLAWDR